MPSGFTSTSAGLRGRIRMPAVSGLNGVVDRPWNELPQSMPLPLPLSLGGGPGRGSRADVAPDVAVAPEDKEEEEAGGAAGFASTTLGPGLVGIVDCDAPEAGTLAWAGRYDARGV